MYKQCVIISCLPIHQLVAKLSSYFIEIEWWQSFHYIYQLHCIWQSLVFEVITYSLCNTWFVLWQCGGYEILGWQYDTQYELLRIYVHHGAPFCVFTVKRHCLPLTRLPRVAGGAPAVNHKATAIRLALWILAGNEHCNVCDGNVVSEYIFNFCMATYEWMHSKYICRICNYLFCIHAKDYKHISPSYFKPDAQSLKFCWRCSYWIFSQFSIQGFYNL